MQWETWVQGCADKNPALNARRWLESTVDQNVIMREESVRGVGDLLSGKSVPLNNFSIPSYTTEPRALEEVLTQVFLWGGNLSVEPIVTKYPPSPYQVSHGRFKAIIMSEGRHRPAIGEAPDAGAAVCLAAIEYADLAMNTDLDDWIKGVLEKGE